MRLTNLIIKNAKPKEKAYKLFDGGGLYIEILPAGGKYWRMKYRYEGNEKRIALGVYPQVTLAKARDKRETVRNQLAEGVDPGAAKKEAKRKKEIKIEETMEAVARAWYEHNVHRWSAHYARDVINRLETHIFPILGSRPISEITTRELLDCLKVIERSGAYDMAQRMLQTCGQVYRHAIIMGHAEHNITANLKGALKPHVPKHNSYLKAEELPEYLQKLEVYDGEILTKLALKLMLLTFVRTQELRRARWEEINFDNALWRIPAENVKMKEDHIVPLSKQAVEVLREIQKQSGNREYIFPNINNPNKCMSNNTMLFALYRMGYKSRTTVHGFRSTASTILNESGFAADWIERQLDHRERNKVRASYNHAQHLKGRREMINWWGDYIEQTIQKAIQSDKK